MHQNVGVRERERERVIRAIRLGEDDDLMRRDGLSDKSSFRAASSPGE